MKAQMRVSTRIIVNRVTIAKVMDTCSARSRYANARRFAIERRDQRSR